MEPVKLLEKIFLSAVDAVNPYKIIKKSVKLKDNNLQFIFENQIMEYNLKNIEKIYVIGIGKAAAKMAKAIEDILGERIDEGIIITKYGHTENLKFIKQFEAGHPVPDENGFNATKKILQLLKRTTEKTMVITLISGGGSSLFVSPYEDNKFKLTLSNLKILNEELLKSGASIDEINCVRKHFSNIKGGKYLQLLKPAQSINLILSDVIGDSLDTIASGITAADKTSFFDVKTIFEKYELKRKLPDIFSQILEAGLNGEIADTPKQIDKKVKNIIIGSNRLAILAAERKAKELGLMPLTPPTFITKPSLFGITGDVKDVSDFYTLLAFHILDDSIKRNEFITIGKDKSVKLTENIKKNAIVIGGGETTVEIKGNGKGGRNQEMALLFLKNFENKKLKNVYFLSASTDGNDGPTDAAGAFATYELYKKSKELGLEIDDYLNRNDSYHFFEKCNGLLKTGPTNTNVCDIQLLLIL